VSESRNDKYRDGEVEVQVEDREFTLGIKNYPKEYVSEGRSSRTPLRSFSRMRCEQHEGEILKNCKLGEVPSHL
jgi:hypothetical protein